MINGKKISIFNLKFSISPGFTLLEILVVISIIGILIAMGTAAYTAAQKKGRDSKRRADVQQIQKAFEQYNADNNGFYLDSNCSGMASDYMPSGMPVDPKTGVAYACQASDTDYCLCAELEETDKGNASDDACTFGSGAYFCTTNLQ